MPGENKEIDIKALRESVIFSQIDVLLNRWAEWLIDNLNRGIDFRKYMDDNISEVWYFLKDALKGAVDQDVRDQLEYITQQYMKFTSILQSIRAYIRELIIADEVIGIYYHERVRLKELQHTVDTHMLLHRIEDFILCLDLEEEDDDNEDMYTEQDLRIQDVMDILPMPLTKQEFYDYVRRILADAFEYMDEASVDEAIKRLEQHFTGRLEPHYGVFFPHIADEISRIQALTPLKLSMQELENTGRAIVALMDDIWNILSICIIMREGLLAWKNWLENGERAPLAIWIQAVGYIEQLEQINPGAVSQEQMEELRQGIKDTLSSQWESEDAKPNPLEILLNKDKFDDRSVDDLTDEINKLIPDEEVYGADVDWEIESDEPADEEYIQAKINELIGFIDDSIAGMPSMYRRVRMKALMLAMPVGFYDVDEFLDYVENALEFMPSDGVLAFIEERFDKLLKEYEEDEDETVDDYS